MSRKKEPLSVYQLKVTLLGLEPPIWRRIQVPDTLLLSGLHDALQAALGWTDSHLHQFVKGDTYWSDPGWYEDFDDIEVIDESRVRIGQVLLGEGDSVRYDYDFGDNWQHEILLEKILSAPGVRSSPQCTGGERHGPPEDVGGTGGYEEFLEVILDPTHEEHEHYREWAGGAFQPEEFDVKAVNEVLSRMRWPVRRRPRDTP